MIKYCYEMLRLNAWLIHVYKLCFPQQALDMNYGQSLFERLYEFFRLKPDNPVHLLETQYRMHPAISQFPNVHVYNGRLNNDRFVLYNYIKYAYID